MTLEEALNDPEGHALVDAILARKAAYNAREKLMQMLIYGEVWTDGHGNVLPRPEPAHWQSIRSTFIRGEIPDPAPIPLMVVEDTALRPTEALYGQWIADFWAGRSTQSPQSSVKITKL